jgi:hypothetical protein
MSVYKSQNQEVLSHLKDRGSLTQMEAARLYQCWRLGARIKDLRNAGWNILTEMIHAGHKRYARYWLVSKNPGSTKGLFPEGEEA